MFPDEGSNLSVLHWQADSLPLSHMGSPGKLLLRELIPWFGLPKSLQSENGSSFITIITQRLTLG